MGLLDRVTYLIKQSVLFTCSIQPRSADVFGPLVRNGGMLGTFEENVTWKKSS
jgi:hypothetical protein